MSAGTSGEVSNAPTITVLYFAAASTETRLTTEQVPLPTTQAHSTHEDSNSSQHQGSIGGFPLSALADVLVARHPGTRLGAVLAQSQWAVDEEMVDDPARVVLKGGEEVAVICPVSGG